MSFPPIAELCADVFRGITTDEEKTGEFTTRDGASTPAAGMLNILDPERYAEYGTVVLAHSRQLILQRSEVPSPQSGDKWTCGNKVYRLQEPLGWGVDCESAWLVVLERTAP